MEGVDFSYARPDPACLVRAGKRFVVRYLSHDTAKALSKAEADRYLAAGLDIVCVFEDSAGRALQGHDAGAADAEFAATQMTSCGGPGDGVIFFAVDEDVSPEQVQSYFDGTASVIGQDRTGPYGSYRIETGVVRVGHRWQTYAWSGGMVLATADLYQYRNGVTLCESAVDLTRAFAANYGGWRVSQLPPPLSPIPLTGDIDMARQRIPITITTDSNGDGYDAAFEQRSIAWTAFLGAFLNGTDPDMNVDKNYPDLQATSRCRGNWRAQQRDGKLLVEVMGCQPNSSELVWVDVVS